MTAFDISLQHAFDADTALDVTFTAPGGVTALFGRSGAGKTSVIRAVAGLLRADTAHVTVNGKVLSDAKTFKAPHKRKLGYVFQEPRLFPHMSVMDNIRYGAPALQKKTRREAVIDLLGLGEMLSRAPTTLSGGEAQRVAIARALLSEPDALLMDEPLASLDAARKAQVLPFLEKLHSESGVPILYVSHDMAEVARLADTLVVIESGRIVAQGPAQTLLSDPTLVPHLGVQNAGAVVPGVLRTQNAGDGLSRVTVPGGSMLVPQINAEQGAALRLRIPATDVMIATSLPDNLSALNILPVRISKIEEGRGPGVMVQLSLDGTPILARITQRSAATLELSPGQEVFAILKTVSVAPGAIGAVPLPDAQAPLPDAAAPLTDTSP